VVVLFGLHHTSGSAHFKGAEQKIDIQVVDQRLKLRVGPGCPPGAGGLNVNSVPGQKLRHI
jgi:hypothetical protein